MPKIDFLNYSHGYLNHHQSYIEKLLKNRKISPFNSKNGKIMMKGNLSPKITTLGEKLTYSLRTKNVLVLYNEQIEKCQ